MTIDVTITAGSPVPDIGLFAPGVPTSGTNLLTGTGAGYGGPYPVVITVAAVGAYTLAIEDSQADFLEAPFSYTLDVTSDQNIVPGPQLISGGPESLAPIGRG